jgi:hypothetical protein
MLFTTMNENRGLSSPSQRAQDVVDLANGWSEVDITLVPRARWGV